MTVIFVGGASGGGGGVVQASSYRILDLNGTYGADPTFATDSTAAFMAAITDAIGHSAAAGGAPSVIYAPGHYKITNLVLPARKMTTTAPARVSIVGDGGPSQFPPSPLGGEWTYSPVGGTIIESVATSGNAIDSTPVAAQHAPSNIRLHLQDLTVRVPANPQIGGVNAGFLSAATVGGYVAVDTPLSDDQIVAPTHGTVGFTFPRLDNYGPNGGDILSVTGFDTGCIVSEHLQLDHLSSIACLNGLKCSAGQHGWHITRYLGVWCPVFLGPEIGPVDVANNAASPYATFNISHAGFEESGGVDWHATTYYVDDVNNYLHGRFYYVRVISGAGLSGVPIPVRGATHVTATSLYP